ncbi:UDP-N-acetylmuramate dehydrogenase [Arcticibacterium luteifluviistationis]|uniref:UDP-N-acetylenolpyruvoylglucosamine reductase n=1 Tax=Arcticibacterium luteifluviistationis TaxID=1784714 RepID=A0A2Z4GE40_9BACT|nr:UDP-N-acetylmuramate dehydrogenase [Arcticibacterium luteifluviistationis]AWV99562.1 UDP-N-acetylenolpyruvoylglucosamine reductase [Arcticibacterium luteifluviistationis]
MPNILKNTSLKAYNTFGIEASAKLFVEINSTNELLYLLGSDEFKENETLILGGGSNVLLTQNFDGLVLKNNIKGIELIEETEDEVLIRVGSGEVWHAFVLYCVDKNYGGIENLSLIPGTVGAAPMQNIGAYGVEIKDVFMDLEAIDRKTKEIKKFDKNACAFGYRESVFKNIYKNQYFITHVTFRLQKNPKLHLEYGAIKDTLKELEVTDPSINDVSKAVIKIRQSKLPDPAEIGNSGSFFKNPIISKNDFDSLKAEYPQIPSYPIDKTTVKVPAGWLIEQAGWKGKTIGEIGVHKNQALVLVNYGNGKGADIQALSKDIQASILEKYGINLHAEVNII